MSAVHHEETAPSLHMGLPLPNGKLAIWLFLVTEIMFFTGLIGAYIVLRQSTPERTISYEGVQQKIHWPTPHDVHLEELFGAVNTFVLICSSLTIVLAHHALSKNQVGKATGYVAVTLLLGCVFMGIKAVEYKAKIDHGILPGRIGDHLEYPEIGYQYKDKVRGELRTALESAKVIGGDPKKDEGKPKEVPEEFKPLFELFSELDGKVIEPAVMDKDGKETKPAVLGPAMSPLQVGQKVNQLLAQMESHDSKSDKKHVHVAHVHLTPYVPYGNLWASCYFAMTGFHALHVLGGLVIFVIILLKAAAGTFGKQHEGFLEITGLYWHFVDIVWIFLFPLLYLV